MTEHTHQGILVPLTGSWKSADVLPQRESFLSSRGDRYHRPYCAVPDVASRFEPAKDPNHVLRPGGKLPDRHLDIHQGTLRHGLEVNPFEKCESEPLLLSRGQRLGPLRAVF